MPESISEQWQCHILDLNDDCIFKIYEFLPAIDWCSLREACTRLQTISDICFQRQYKSLELKGKFIYGSENDLLTMVDVKRLIRNFGQWISTLNITRKSFVRGENFKKLIPLLDRYCKKLRNLQLVKIDFDSEVIGECHRIFGNLRRLMIEKCIDNEVTLSSCITLCVSLKVLELTRLTKVDGHCLANNFKTLESFTVNYCTKLQYGHIREFMVKNSQLKTLNFVKSNLNTKLTTVQVFEDICNYLPNLLELSLRFCFEEFNGNVEQPLAKVRKLQIVGRHGLNLNPLLHPLTVHKTIENLHLASIVIHEEITETLCKLKTLKILKFTAICEVKRDIYKKLLSELPSLVEIYIINCKPTTFSDLIELVEHSINVKKIVFIPYDRSSLTQDIFSSLINVRRENNGTLKVHVNIHDHVHIVNDLELTKMLVEHYHKIKFFSSEE